MNFPLPMPLLKPFSSISPSRYFGMRECLLREALTSARPQFKLPSSPKAALGTVSHRLVEESSKGALGHGRENYEKRWDELVVEEEKKLPTYQQPLRKSCGDYGVARALAIRAAERCHSIQKARAEDDPADEKKDTGARYGPELQFVTKDKRFRGNIDLVSPSDKGPVIRDYKTGKIIDPETNEVKDAYDLQLKLYSAIYADSEGCWPCRAELIALDGHLFIVEVDRNKCTELLDEARAFLDGSNNLLDRIASGASLPADAAHPSPQACRFCLYRPYCPSYFSTTKTSPEEWPQDVFGTVESTSDSPNERWVCTLNAGGNKTVVVRRLSKNRYPEVKKGDQVGFFGLSRENAPDTYKEGATTSLLG